MLVLEMVDTVQQTEPVLEQLHSPIVDLVLVVVVVVTQTLALLVDLVSFLLHILLDNCYSLFWKP
jgi:hypothetical protein